jgi:RNA polymerase sigma-70 factor (ECF subfamily)
MFIGKKKHTAEKEALFDAVLKKHKQLIMKVCYMYATDDEMFKDLYQEVVINMWQGIEKFRGDAQTSTWIYRVAMNTCVTYFRKNSKHGGTVSLENACEIASEDSTKPADLRAMYQLISQLTPLEKVIIMMWLDENGYDEISAATGLSRANVASKLSRIKLKLIKEGNK